MIFEIAVLKSFFSDVGDLRKYNIKRTLRRGLSTEIFETFYNISFAAYLPAIASEQKNFITFKLIQGFHSRQLLIVYVSHSHFTID